MRLAYLLQRQAERLVPRMGYLGVSSHSSVPRDPCQATHVRRCVPLSLCWESWYNDGVAFSLLFCSDW